MITLKELNKKGVLTSDGVEIGIVSDVKLERSLNIAGLSLRIDKKMAEDLALDKPFLSSMKGDISIEHVKSISDSVLLNKRLEDLYKYIRDDTEWRPASELVDYKISDSNGKDIGEVHELLLDEENWGIPEMIVTIKKDTLELMDMKKSLLSKTKLGISMEHVENIGDYIMLDTNADNLGEIIKEESVKKV